MRNVSFVMPLRAERVSEVSSPKNIREEEQTKRVRDVKESEKQEKKKHRIFRIRRTPMTPQQQRQLAKLVNSYQLRAMRDWYSFSSQVDAESLNDAQLWILQAANQSQHLYPKSVRKQIKEYLNMVNIDAGQTENQPDSQAVQQLVAYEHYLEGLISMLVLCRRFDKREKKNRDKIGYGSYDDEAFQLETDNAGSLSNPEEQIESN
ncbi:ATP-dependent exonuclease [Vibrio mimicus]|uniref:ATP-dependent exonuclease n=1 Tax=Vibrio parahaemolyticus TaxID=670 RepID=UPI00193E2897|nr:ATP-dependent exonuclease [Vibrio parahaemolyticus]EIK4811200.1 ATP-dependent exonuclease [Vibrio parahaemolyticus]EJC1212077.1 ATP-dependent exonuclease [Vibrio parahaemolyticus]EJG1998063.1 ATP-dependent exonuclease [Vibrio parahaemolyticus]MBM4959723.1 ATP-dependent exonuclease [Vibrio parahaemolyticus]